MSLDISHTLDKLNSIAETSTPNSFLAFLMAHKDEHLHAMVNKNTTEYVHLLVRAALMFKEAEQKTVGSKESQKFIEHYRSAVVKVEEGAKSADLTVTRIKERTRKSFEIFLQNPEEVHSLRAKIQRNDETISVLQLKSSRLDKKIQKEEELLRKRKEDLAKMGNSCVIL